MVKKKLFLIDAHALCYRAYFAVQHLRTSYGQPTNAVFGFVNTLKKIIKDFSPDYMVTCFDTGKKTHRQEKFSQYKIHRPSMPEDLISQIALIKELILAYQIPIFELEGFEADDIIATIAKQVRSEKIDVMIVSGDKDMVQLVGGNVKIFDYRNEMVVDESAVYVRYGFKPESMIDFIALAGDQTDNIPGVTGIGKVTATQLIRDYGTLDDVFKNLSALKSQRLREKLQIQKKQAFMSQDLAKLDSRVPIDFNLKTIKYIGPDCNRLRSLFDKLEFTRFSQELSGSSQGVSDNGSLPIKNIKKIKEARDLCAEIVKNKFFAFHFEKNFSQRQQTSIDRLFLATSQDSVFVIAPECIQELRSLFCNPGILKICHNIKRCLKILTDHQLLLSGKIFDVMLAGYVLEASQGLGDVSALAFRYLKHSFSKDHDSAEETAFLVRLFSIMQKELDEKSLTKLMEEVEVPLAHVLYRMQECGVCLDIAFLQNLSADVMKTIEHLAGKIYQIAGEQFNLNSPKQLSDILFQKLKLPIIKKTKTGFSTDEGVLEKLAKKHKLPAMLLEYRQLAKLKTTYIDALPKLVDQKTKRIHAIFDQAGTETGRLSSRNPNLQNIPIRTDLGRKIRKAFVASDSNHIIVSADYSQIELRLLAHLSKDSNLVKAFQENQDIHEFTARLIFDVSFKKITSEMRMAAKRVNFGIVYGMSAFGLAKDLNISQTEAQEFIDRYFLRYPGVLRYMQKQIQYAQENGFVLTLLNRRRYIPEIHSPHGSIRQFAERQAINTPVQGSAADLIKIAMIRVQRKIDDQGLCSRMTITVHDELVFDVLLKEQKLMQHLIQHEMEQSLILDVPIKVSMKTGKNWLEMKEVKS